MANRLFESVAAAEAHNARVRKGWRERRGLGEEVSGTVSTKPNPGGGVIHTYVGKCFGEQQGFNLVLPWPPTLNHSGLDGFRGGRKTTAYKDFMGHVAALVMARRIKPLHGRLHCSIVAFPPDRRARDLDNLIKPVLDALQRAGCFTDDEAFDSIDITRVQGPERGIISVTVRPA